MQVKFYCIINTTPSTPTQSFIRIHLKLFKLLGQRMAHTLQKKTTSLSELISMKMDLVQWVHTHTLQEKPTQNLQMRKKYCYRKSHKVSTKRAAGRGKCNALVSTEKLVKKGRQGNSQSPKKKKEKRKKRTLYTEHISKMSYQNALLMHLRSSLITLFYHN